jgi:hypothetical protein
MYADDSAAPTKLRGLPLLPVDVVLSNKGRNDIALLAPSGQLVSGIEVWIGSVAFPESARSRNARQLLRSKLT